MPPSAQYASHQPPPRGQGLLATLGYRVRWETKYSGLSYLLCFPYYLKAPLGKCPSHWHREPTTQVQVSTIRR